MDGLMNGLMDGLKDDFMLDCFDLID